MSFKIATNTASINVQRYLSTAQAAMSKSLERLSSGYKLNRAADDAAGIAIANKLSVKLTGISKAVDNGNQAIAMLQTAEGGISQINDILARLKELAGQAASDNVGSTDRTTLDGERAKLEGEIDKIANNTRYESTALLKGANTVGNVGTNLTVGNGIASIDASGAAADTYTLAVSGTALTLSNTGGSSQTIDISSKPTGFNTTVVNFSSLGVKVTVNASLANVSTNNTFDVSVGASSFAFQLGSDNDARDQVNISIGNFAADGTVLALSGDLTTQANARAYIDKLDTAITNLNTQRANIGAVQNQLTYHVNNLSVMQENTKSAISVIKDADYAAEMAEFTRNQIITQAGIAMVSQANQLPQMILSLLKQ